MTSSDLDHQLRIYGELAVKVGLNLRAGQRLLIIGPLANGGASLEAAPLVRHIAASAYQAGAPLVETLWGDEALQLARFRHAPRDSFGEFSTWLPKALLEHAEAGHAIMSVYANDPDRLKDEPPELVGAVQQAVSRSVRPFRELHFAQPDELGGGRGRQPRLGGAACFPHLPPDEQIARCGRPSAVCAVSIGRIRWRRGKTHLDGARRAPRLPEQASGTPR